MSDRTHNEASGDLARLQRSAQAIASLRSAQQNMRNGRFAPALASYHNLVQQFPGVPQLWAELGGAATGGLEFSLADQALERARELASANTPLLISIGMKYYDLRRLDQAFVCLKRAVEADPSSGPACLALASWLERTRRFDEAWECVEAYLSRQPKDGRMRYFKAQLLHSKGRNEEAETALRNLLKSDPLLPLDVKADASHLLAVVLDAFGNYTEAWICLAQAKALRRKISNVAGLEQINEKNKEARRGLLAELTPETIRRWREEAGTASVPQPLALLGGALRSGTTLLEQIFAAHPEILVFDEPPAFTKEIAEPLQPPPPAQRLTLKTLNGLDSEARGKLAARYFKSLLRETEEKPGSRLLLDKNPSTTRALPVWLRLFPQSKVLIALRDPRDVIISCYFQNINLNWGNFSFLSLEQTAAHYAESMDVWLRTRELGGFDWIETRYEDVVANLEQEGRRVTNFLGLPWHESQSAYYETARGKFLHSPTYNEVTKPVYTRAVGRWQRYAEGLAPIQATLGRHVQAFGYA